MMRWISVGALAVPPGLVRCSFPSAVGKFVDIERPTPPDTYPPINADHGGVNPAGVAVGSAVVGAAIGAALVKSKQLDDDPKEKE